MNLKEMMAKYRAGEITIEQLNDAFQAEETALNEIATAISANQNIMEISSLEGEDVVARQNQYNERCDVSNQVMELIRQADATQQAAQQRNSQPVRPRRESPQPSGLQVSGDLNGRTPLMATARQTIGQYLVQNSDFQAWSQLDPVDRRQRAFTFPETIPVQNIGSPYLQNDVTYSAPIERRDRVVVQPAPLQRALDQYSIVDEPDRSNIVFHRLRANTTAAATRARGATIGVANPIFDRVTVEKQSIGVYTPIDNELAQWSPSMVAGTIDALVIDQDDELETQLMMGDNSGNNWHGIVTQTTASQTYTATSPPTTYGAVRSHIGQMQLLGLSPTAILMRQEDADKVYSYLLNLSFAHPDLFVGPDGGVKGIPIRITSKIPANNILIVTGQPNHTQAVMGGGRRVEISTEALFLTNQLAVRVIDNGNVALYLPVSNRRLAGTNNLTDGQG